MSIDREQAALDKTAANAGVHALGKYLVIAELARGGMGVVHLALLRRPGASTKLLVLKELKAELLEEPAVLTMFMQEARLAACLNHPNVVRTYEAGSDGQRRFIAMEYLDGQPLHRVLSRVRKGGRPIPLEFHGAVLCSALEGLAYAHAALDVDGKPMGLVHRDMSPHNVFVCYDGQVKVLDFGIAKALNSWVDTRTGILKGKVPYMSPEHAAGKPVDARTDVFAVGVMLWEAATGRRFWSGVGDVEILRSMSQGRFSAEHEGAMEDVHEELRAVVAKATALDPSSRYASAPEFLTELRSALARRRAQPWGQQEIGRFVEELFIEDHARLQLVIKEALRSQTQTVSGQYLVSELRSRSVPSPPLDAASFVPDVAPTIAPPASLAAPLSTKPPPVPSRTTPDARQGLLAAADAVGLAVSSLQESERVAALPQSVEAIVRAVHAVGGHDVATALEALSDCMDVIQTFDQWRLSVTEYLRSLEPSESVTELIDFEPVDALPVATTVSLETPAPPEPFGHGPALRLVDVQDIEPPVTARLPPMARPSRLVAWVLLAVLSVLVTAVWMLALRRPPEPPAASTTRAASVPAAATAVAPVLLAPLPERVHVIVRALPAKTRIVIDGTLVFENPSVVVLPKDGATHTMHVDADGYVPRDESFDANGDRTFVLALEPAKGPGARSGSTPRGAAPPAPPQPPPAASGASVPAGSADKCYLGRPDKNHPTDDVRSVPRGNAPWNARDEMP